MDIFIYGLDTIVEENDGVVDFEWFELALALAEAHDIHNLS